MNKIIFFQLFVLLIIPSSYQYLGVDCNPITAFQNFIREEFSKIRNENTRISTRLKRLEASTCVLTTDPQVSATAVHGAVYSSASCDKAKNDSKRIDAIESSLAQIMTLLQVKMQTKTNAANEPAHAQRIDRIESDLALVSKNIDRINSDNENMISKLNSTMKKTFRDEKRSRLKSEHYINETIKTVNDDCVKRTEATERLISDFTKEVTTERKTLKDEINKTVIHIFRVISDHKNDVDSTFDNLQKETNETKQRLSHLDEIVINYNTVYDMTKDLDPSYDKRRNDIKRIDTIESTLARIVPQFESYIQNKTDDIKQRTLGLRIDRIESELALVSNRTDNLLDMNGDSGNAMAQLHRTMKKAFHGETIKRLNLELEMNEKVKSIESYCVNFTRTSGQFIDEFKKEVAIENKEFAAEMNQEEIKIKKTINDNKIDADSSFDDLENEFSKIKKTLSNLEDIILRNRTDGGWSIWGSFGLCSDTCGRGVTLRSRTCANPKPSLKGNDSEGSPVQVAVCYRNPCPVCSLEEVDLVIIIDASTSVTAPNFQKIRDFCKDIVDLSGVDSGSARIGVLIYSSDVEIQFHLNEYNTTAAMKAAIDKIHYIYGSTNTADAIMTMYSRMFTRSNGDRPRVPNVGIVVTDGISNINSRRTIPEANNARTKDIELYAIGIGLTDTRELDAIADTPTDNFSFKLKVFAELAGVAETIFGDGCGKSTTNILAVEKAVVTTKQPDILAVEKTSTKQPGCSLAEEVDLVIIMDASTSVTQSNFQKMLEFCKDLVDYTDVDSGNARIGVLIYSTVIEIQFYLNEFNTTAAVKTAIDKIRYIYGSTNTADAIMTMYSKMFTTSKGDRPGVQNVGIVLTDGISNINSRRTIPEANNARTKDIELYAIGIGLVDTRELDAIANAPTEQFSFSLNKFEELAGLAKTLIVGGGCATSAPDL